MYGCLYGSCDGTISAHTPPNKILWLGLGLELRLWLGLGSGLELRTG